MKSFIFILISLISCAKIEINKPQIQFEHDVFINLNGTNIYVKANTPYEFPDQQPVKVHAPGKIAMILYPYNYKSNFKVQLPRISETQIEEYQLAKINNTINSLMPEVQQVQKFILNSDYDNALSKIRDLKIKHPDVAYLSFLEGACYSVLGRNSDAKKALQEGFEISPESPSAKELYRTLSGEQL